MEPILTKIKAILKKEIGLDASTVGAAAIEKIVNERMKSCQITDIDEYYNYLSNTQKELHLLLETSVIPETWFFRDDKPFNIILNSISKQLVHNPTRRCKILCIPCSTGEEPYSISIFLHENGIPESAYEIQAVDISHNSISIARQANYTKNSFRGDKAKAYCEKYFTLTDTTYALNDSIKTSVAFSQMNILDSDKLPNFKFDFILCRNLLIYFDVSTKDKAYNNLYRLLNEDGKLFIGHSEYGSVPKTIFNIVKYDSVFCLVKNTDKPEENNYSHGISSNTKPNSSLRTSEPAHAPAKKAFSDTSKFHANNDVEPVKLNTQEKTSFTEHGSDKTLIEQARSLADGGKLNEAESLCLKYIDEHGDHEETFFLLGLISEASNNDTQAQTFFKKALYLNPKHYETLIHLSYIIESQGDIEGSQRLKERAERASKK